MARLHHVIAFVSYTVKAQIYGATLRAMNDIIVPISHLTIFAVQILHGELFSDQKRLYSLSDTRYEASRLSLKLYIFFGH